MKVEKFLTVGLGLLVILAILNIAGWIESLESRDRYRHCIMLNSDAVYTDAEAEALKRRCALKLHYDRSLGE